MQTIPNPNHARTVVGLSVENFKRVQAVDITPEQGQPIVAISGRNAQGKSSVLDALWAALESSAMSRGTGTTRPVRDGEKKATVRVDLGDIVVTRTWTAGGTSKLAVAAADSGAEFKTPQKLLDALLGRMSFDPLAFTRLSAKEQVNTLSVMVDIPLDLDQVAADRAEMFERRTEIGRQRKSLGDAPAVDTTLPTEETTATAIIADIREAQAQNEERDRADLYAADATNQRDEILQRIEDLRRQAADLDANITKARARVAETEPVDTAALEADLASVEDTNRRIRENNAARDHAARADALTEQYDGLTADIAKLDKDRADALAAAKFPLEGLSLVDWAVTYQGVPLGQASTAEQLRVSCALAAAASPSVRVMRVTDGSLLDADSRQAIADIAAEHGFQVWMELVDESGEVGVVIEDGRVKGAEA